MCIITVIVSTLKQNNVHLYKEGDDSFTAPWVVFEFFPVATVLPKSPHSHLIEASKHEKKGCKTNNSRMN